MTIKKILLSYFFGAIITKLTEFSINIYIPITRVSKCNQTHMSLKSEYEKKNVTTIIRINKHFKTVLIKNLKITVSSNFFVDL